MLRTNLSTRPFYNERIVRILVGLAVVVIGLLTAFNAIRIVALSRQNTEFSALINHDRSEADRLNAEARRIRAGIDQNALKATAEAAAAANRLIDQRTFSWTEFFNLIEETLPADVMLTAVRPSIANDRSMIDMTVLSRRMEDIDEFIDKLEATGAFHELLPTHRDENDEGLQQVVLHGEYRRVAAAAKPVEQKGSPAPQAKPAPTAPAPGPGRGAAQ
jgi:hypothetical protein